MLSLTASVHPPFPNKKQITLRFQNLGIDWYSRSIASGDIANMDWNITHQSHVGSTNWQRGPVNS